MKQLIIAVLLFIAACNSAPVKEKQQEVPKANSTVATLRVNDDKLHAMYEQYAQLITALTNENTREARFAANAMAAVAAQLPGADKVGASAAGIAATADIQRQRVALAALSEQLLQLLKAAGMASGELYVDFCPMALNDKGAIWLSSNKAIRNPYFGDSMLTCGSIKETIQ
ncbi:Protein of unknown function [Chitinophaga jiangningensis]|uniref:DUF3347 domain-containing protein n=1 Tax=Chitinophaga jiangningensis TaxID=1419482 RepID=A0A1M7KJD5_9BACT|nr:DUF3347 domain-containing protein [Chitinophaga jiangningensis]SHM65526.1 Protein of unknown function [Chitinophaga jiangningensis]